MNLGNVVQRLIDTDKHFGHAAALYDLEYRGVNRLVPVSVLRGMTAVVQDIDPRLFNAGPFAARFCTQKELLASVEEPEVREEMTPEFVERALLRGDECFGIFDGERLASFGWYSSRPTSIDSELYLYFDSAWMYMYKGFTLGAYRGKRLHGIGMSLALREYTARGSKGLISYVEANNFASLRSTEKMGYKRFGSVYVARVGGRVATWSTPGCKPYGFRVALTADEPPSDVDSSISEYGEYGARDVQDRHGVYSSHCASATMDSMWRDFSPRAGEMVTPGYYPISPNDAGREREARALHL